jgi:hypothetical protein
MIVGPKLRLARWPWLAVGLLAFRLTSAPLYDASLGTLPDQQHWDLVSLPATLTATLVGGGAQLDTRNSLGEYSGFSRLAPDPLNRTNGFRVRFSLQVLAETHRTEHRSGVSLIILSADKLGIELAFWTNRIWVQSDSPMFTHGEETTFDTTQGMVTYELRFQANSYSLQADGSTILSGAIRDYTPFQGVLDPYETPNLLFLGDDTSSAAGWFRWRDFEIVQEGPRTARLVVEPLHDGTGALRFTWPSGFQLQSAGSLSPDQWTRRAVDSPAIISPIETADFFRLIAN